MLLDFRRQQRHCHHIKLAQSPQTQARARLELFENNQSRHQVTPDDGSEASQSRNVSKM